MIFWFRTRTPSSPMAPMPSSGWNGIPSLRTTITSSGAPSARATSKATGTPPRGRPSTTTRCPRRCCSLAASCRPASARSAKRTAPLLPVSPSGKPGFSQPRQRTRDHSHLQQAASCSRARRTAPVPGLGRRAQGSAKPGSCGRHPAAPLSHLGDAGTLESLIHSAVCKAAEHLRPAQVRSPGSTPRILASSKA
jgi:hypothetical protein